MFEWRSVCGARPAVMGIVNVTPDSFSDGGRFVSPASAIDHGLTLVDAGADLLDVGGESTRPGADPVTDAEERRRVVPVIAGLAAAGVPVSIDTTKAGVAAAALDAGATIVNDVSAGLVDPDLLPVVAAAGAGYVAMHMQGEPRTMQDSPHYDDVVVEVGDFLAARLDAARSAGIAPRRCAPILGSGSARPWSTTSSSWCGFPELVERLGVPVLVGTSRKRFLGTILAGVAG